MRDKLLKILKVRIDAINRNIDNLNYLNSELEKNTADLNYIQYKIEIFAANNILNFDNLSHDDFEKILMMIDPSVADVFQDKTCNYQGIMYIIQGIRQGVSLELTDAQANAIRLLIGEMINKKASLEDVIKNLNESKTKLPETEMAVLTSSLKNFQTIISKLEENLYIIEVDDIIASLEFSNVPMEEKVGIFEFLLKYNTKIYTDNQTQITETKEDDEYSLKEINVPEFHYEPINIYNDLEPDFNKGYKSDLSYSEPSFEDKYGSLDETSQIPLTFPSYEMDSNLNDLDKEEEKELKESKESFVEPIAKPVEKKPTSFSLEPEKEEVKKEEKVDLPSFDVVTPKVEPIAPLSEIEIPAPTENKEIKKEEFQEIAPMDTNSYVETKPQIGSETKELEDIIGKIDARLKEMETETKHEMFNKVETESNGTVTNNDTELLAVLAKYSINKEKIELPINVLNSEVEKTLDYLNELGVLEQVKENNKLLNLIIRVAKEDLEKVVDLLKNKFTDNEVTIQDVLQQVIETIPVILTSKSKIESFSANLNFLEEHNISLGELFNRYPEVLILDNETLVANYNKIKGYGIDLTNANIKYLICNKRVLENIDYYIEALGSEKGFLGREEEFNGYECVVNNPYKLNNISKEVLMKLRYATENGKKIFSNKQGILSGEITNPKVDVITLPNEYVNLYFDKEYSSISKEALDNLVKELDESKNVDMTITPVIEALDNKYKIDDLRYRIGNLIFSRIKTIRLYNFLTSKNLGKDALLIALTYNSVLKREEFAKISDIVADIEGGN